MDTEKAIICKYSRPNQVYPDRRSQIAAANARARANRIAKNSIQKKLDKNRNTIKNLLCGKPDMILSYDFICGAGLDSHFFTNFSIIDKIKQLTEFYVYDYGFMKVDINKIKIFKV